MPCHAAQHDLMLRKDRTCTNIWQWLKLTACSLLVSELPLSAAVLSRVGFGHVGSEVDVSHWKKWLWQNTDACMCSSCKHVRTRMRTFKRMHTHTLLKPLSTLHTYT